jgi:hypothetical protein
MLMAEISLAAALEPWISDAPDPRVVPAIPALPSGAALAALKADAAWIDRWARQSPNLAWGDAALQLIVKYRQNPLRAARALAYLHVALHDALAHCLALACSEAAQRAAMHAAGGRLLSFLYPAETQGRWSATSLGAVTAVAAAYGGIPDLERAWQAADRASRATVARAMFDRSDGQWDLKERPAPGPNVWRATPPLMVHDPTEPTAPRWRTWVLADSSDVEVAPPPAYGSANFRAEVDEVLQVARTLTAEQKRIAEEWNLDLGTVTPGGVWNKRAAQLAVDSGLNLADVARLFAAMNVAVIDALIACWRVKLTEWTARPITLIRDTRDAAFTPHVLTPAFPGYPSGHATISAAAATLLGALLPAQRAHLEAAAAEAAMSRLYAGIHFRSDNEEGLRIGRRIGRRVADRVLGGSRVDPALPVNLTPARRGPGQVPAPGALMSLVPVRGSRTRFRSSRRRSAWRRRR